MKKHFNSWRWGICATYRQWINFQMQKAKLDINAPFMYRFDNKTWLLSAETIVSVLIDAGEDNEKLSTVIHSGITERIKNKETMKKIIDNLGAWLIETGYLIHDGKSVVKKINFKKNES